MRSASVGPRSQSCAPSRSRPGAGHRNILTQSSPLKQTCLLLVPGIGKRARERLLQDRVDSTSVLCQKYIKEHNRDKQALIDYLKGVGVPGRWRTTIAEWVHEQTCEASTLTFCVEGNIGAGKSTWLDMVQSGDHSTRRQMADTLEPLDLQRSLSELIEIVPEPVSEWVDLEGTNVLDCFYKDPKKYAFMFQQYVLLTRVSKERETRHTTAALRLMERSVFCDRLVFVKAVHAMQQLSPVELQVYDSWFNPLVDWQPSLVPDGFVYLQTTAEGCHRRLRRRGRAEEVAVAVDYLERLHGFHDSWLVRGGVELSAASPGAHVLGLPEARDTRTLLPTSTGPSGTGLAGAQFRSLNITDGCSRLDLAAAAPGSRQLLVPQLPERLRGNVVLLDAARLQSESDVAAAARLHLVPALHVDCIDDVDITDPEVIRSRTQLMREYRAWVADYQRLNSDLLAQARGAASTQGDARLLQHIRARVAGAGPVPTPLPSGILEALASMQPSM